MSPNAQRLLRLCLIHVLPLLLASCARQPLVLEGTLTYAGRPMAAYTKIQPQFAFRDETTRQATPGITTWYDPETARYRIGNLPETKTSVSVVYNVTGTKETLPGNFSLWHTLTPGSMDPKSLQEYNMPLQTVLRLLDPVNTGTALPAKEALASFTAPLTFRWQGLPEASFYQVTVQQCRENAYPAFFAGYDPCTTVGYSQVPYPLLTLSPSPSPDLRHLRLIISASDAAGNQLGRLVTTYDNGSHESYLRFRIRPRDIPRETTSTEIDASPDKGDL